MSHLEVVELGSALVHRFPASGNRNSRRSTPGLAARLLGFPTEASASGYACADKVVATRIFFM